MLKHKYVESNLNMSERIQTSSSKIITGLEHSYTINMNMYESYLKFLKLREENIIKYLKQIKSFETFYRTVEYISTSTNNYTPRA